MSSEDTFEQFWKSYPRKVGKLDCKRAWDRMKAELPQVAELVAIVEKHKQQPQWKRDAGAYIPHPATWIRQGRWLDELQDVETDQSGQIVHWSETSTGIERKGRELGLDPADFPHFPAFKEAVFRRIQND